MPLRVIKKKAKGTDGEVADSKRDLQKLSSKTAFKQA
jgi:hypothetical protein